MSGGIRVVAIYAQALQAMGHVVTLVSPPPPPPHWKQQIISLLKGKPASRTGPPRSHVAGIGVTHRVIDKYRPIVNSDVPDGDIVIATWWETAEWVNALSPAKGEKVYFVQHYEVFDNLPYHRCRATYRMPLKKITIAQWLVDVMRDEYNDSQVALVPNSVDHALFYAPQRDKQQQPTVGLLFHEAAFKGVDISLAAITKVRELRPNLRVRCFGSYEPSAAHPLPAYFEFYKDPPQEKIRDIYSGCDVWLTASRSEGFNLPAMEAMACRTPVVSTKTGWPAEAVMTGKNGVLTEVDDVEALANGIGWVLGLPSPDWQSVSQAAFDTVSQSSWQHSSAMFEQVLQTLAGNRQ